MVSSNVLVCLAIRREHWLTFGTTLRAFPKFLSTDEGVRFRVFLVRLSPFSHNEGKGVMVVEVSEVKFFNPSLRPLLVRVTWLPFKGKGSNEFGYKISGHRLYKAQS
jgi:hypothetical protein